MNYTITIKPSAEKELDFLPKAAQRRLRTRILSLEQNPRPPGIKKLKGGEGYRLRVGDYRILLLIDDEAKLVDVVAIGHRKEVYR